MGKKCKRSKLVILELDNNNLLNVILFKHTKWNSYVTLGGRVDHINPDFESTLIKEVKEESFNLFDISDIVYLSDRIRHVDINMGHNETTRVFFILLNNGLFDDGIYNTNKNILNSTDVPKAWTEINGYDRFPIENLLHHDKTKLKNKCFNCHNTNDESRKIYFPILKYLREANKSNIIDDLVNGHFVVKDYVITSDVSDTFLNGTCSIRVQ
jgi:hypothetical protein